MANRCRLVHLSLTLKWLLHLTGSFLMQYMAVGYSLFYYLLLFKGYAIYVWIFEECNFQGFRGQLTIRENFHLKILLTNFQLASVECRVHVKSYQCLNLQGMKACFNLTSCICWGSLENVVTILATSLRLTATLLLFNPFCYCMAPMVDCNTSWGQFQYIKPEEACHQSRCIFLDWTSLEVMHNDVTCATSLVRNSHKIHKFLKAWWSLKTNCRMLSLWHHQNLHSLKICTYVVDYATMNL